MALSANRDDQRTDGVVRVFPVAASTKIYAGGLVAINTAGYAVPAADTSSFVCVGSAVDAVDNSAGAAAAATVRVYCKGVIQLDFSGTATQASVGILAYATDDHTVAASSTNHVVVGRVVEFISATSVRVSLSEATVVNVTVQGS